MDDSRESSRGEEARKNESRYYLRTATGLT